MADDAQHLADGGNAMQQADGTMDTSPTRETGEGGTTACAVVLKDHDAFKEAMREWVHCDDRQTYHQQEVKDARMTKTNLLPSILDFIERHSMCDTVFPTKNGMLRYNVESSLSSFTQKFILDGLCAYFESCGESADRGRQCMEFLKKRRVSKMQGTIRRTYCDE